MIGFAGKFRKGIIRTDRTPSKQMEEPKQEEPKQEEPKQEEPKQEEPKQEEPKQEEPKQSEELLITAKETNRIHIPDSIEIIKATYGFEDKVIDVTSIINENKGNKLLINNVTMKGDPAPKKQKTVSIYYKQME